MSLILFPYSVLPESTAKKIITLFGHLTVCLPWYMEPPPFFQEHVDLGHMAIIYPPDNLKPAERIQKILSEYYQWMEQNRDRRYTNILESHGQQDPTTQGRVFLKVAVCFEVGPAAAGASSVPG